MFEKSILQFSIKLGRSRTSSETKILEGVILEKSLISRGVMAMKLNTEEDIVLDIGSNRSEGIVCSTWSHILVNTL